MYVYIYIYGYMDIWILKMTVMRLVIRRLTLPSERHRLHHRMRIGGQQQPRLLKGNLPLCAVRLTQKQPPTQPVPRVWGWRLDGLSLG